MKKYIFKMQSAVLFIFILLFACLTGCTGIYDYLTEQSNHEIITENASTENDSTENDSLENDLTENASTENDSAEKDSTDNNLTEFDFSSVPEYSGFPYVEINDNIPFFSDEELSTASYEEYAELDSLGRCGVCVACIGKDIMPTEKRGKIGHIKPSGWNQKKYPGLVDGNYLYNRCHLIGYLLTGENDNVRNLITGTRYFNTEIMLPFEIMVADYIMDTNNHVMYRVTPYFEGDNLLASGVLMEAKSVEDDEILFCVFCYNIQPGVVIDYLDGSSHLDENADIAGETTAE